LQDSLITGLALAALCSQYLALLPAMSKCPSSKTSLPTWKIRYLKAQQKILWCEAGSLTSAFTRHCPAEPPAHSYRKQPGLRVGPPAFPCTPAGGGKYAQGPKGSFSPQRPNWEVSERPLVM